MIVPEQQSSIGVCERCGARLPAQEGSGRRRRYCPPPQGCKQSAYRQRSFRNTDAPEAALRNDLSAHRPIRPILKYPGAKWRLASWIISFFPASYEHYIEPYCGSAAVFFTKQKSQHEVLNDLNHSIVNLFAVMRTRGEELARAIMLSPWSEYEYNAIEKHIDDTDDELEHARRFLIRSWQAHGGTIAQVSGWKHNGLQGRVYPTQLWKQLPERLLRAAERLQDAEVRCKPALEVIDYYNAPDCLLYIDPPYELSTRSRKYYKHEMETKDHRDLLAALVAHKGIVILSGYAHPLYDELLSKGWEQFEMPSVTEHGNIRTEVLWLNQKAARCRQLSLFAV
jgi:DNA adenine methylase